MSYKRTLSHHLNPMIEYPVSGKGEVMVSIEGIVARISVALSPVEWREVLMHLTDAPELRGLVLDQLKDALGPDYIEELTDSTG
jgi:hypothetical protein